MGRVFSHRIRSCAENAMRIAQMYLGSLRFMMREACLHIMKERQQAKGLVLTSFSAQCLLLLVRHRFEVGQATVAVCWMLVGYQLGT